MYAKVQVVEIAEHAATRRIMQDRQLYLPSLAAAERLAAAEKLIVGGSTATQLLLGEPMGINDFRIELYSVNAHRDARKIANAIYEVDPTGLSQLTTLFTNVPDEEYVVSVNERPLVTVRALVRGKHRRQVRTAQDVIEASERPGQASGAPVMCMGAEIQLLTVYTQLTDPSAAGTWSTLLATEARLRAIFTAEIASKIAATMSATVIGGRARRRKQNVAQLIASIRALAKEPRRALVGDAANDLAADVRLQLITSNSLEAEAKHVTRLGKAAGVRVDAAVNDPGVPTQPRLRRLTVYQIRDGRRYPIADFFNLGEFEVVPTTRLSDGSRAVTLPVSLRIRLVDLWTAQLLRRQGKMKRAAEHLHTLVRKFQHEADEFRRRAAAAREPAEFERLFPLDPAHYIGQYVNPILHQKRVRFRRQTAERKQRQAQRTATAAGKKKAARRPFVRHSFPYYPAAAALKAAREKA